jgi:hypothetical protein
MGGHHAAIGGYVMYAPMDITSETPQMAELRRTAVAVRQWSVALRTWSQLARARSRAIRRDFAHAAPAALPPRDSRVADEVSLGMIPVSELFTILVDHHRFGVREAVSALVVQLEGAGYPNDTVKVSAVDGFDIVQAALEARA